jgi:hypothetical protein
LFDGSFGGAEGFGGILCRKAFDGDEDEGCTIEGLESGKKGVELPESDASFGVHEAIETGFVRFIGMLFATFAQKIDARIGHDSVKPRFDFGTAVVLTGQQSSKGARVRVLQHVFSIGEVSDEARCKTIQWSARVVDDRPERGHVPARHARCHESQVDVHERVVGLLGRVFVMASTMALAAVLTAMVAHARTFLESLGKLGALVGVEDRNDGLDHLDEMVGHRMFVLVLGEHGGGVEFIGLESFQRGVHSSAVCLELFALLVGVFLGLRGHGGFDGLALVVTQLDSVEQEHHGPALAVASVMFASLFLVMFAALFPMTVLARELAAFLHAFLDERHELRSLRGGERCMERLDGFDRGGAVFGVGFLDVAHFCFEGCFIDLTGADFVGEGLVEGLHLIALAIVEVIDGGFDGLALFGGEVDFLEGGSKERVAMHASASLMFFGGSGGFRV